MKFDVNRLKWTREPESYKMAEEKIEIITKPHTDLWQRTYYHFRNWATIAINTSIKSMWYRLSRREDDYGIECSTDGVNFSQMRVCHMWNGGGEIQFGIYACSPEESSFKATFSHMEMTECKWLAHDGQAPDEMFTI